MANAGQSRATSPLSFLKTGCLNKVLVVSGNWATANFGHRCGLVLFISDKRVFVVAAFESVRKLSPSLTKTELLNLWNSGSVQPFYYQTCWKCQKHLDYDAWRRQVNVHKKLNYM